jgi:hypothetical protein
MLCLAEDPALRAAMAQKIPAAPPDPATHARVLGGIYAAVRAGPRHPLATVAAGTAGAAVAAERRSHFLLMQRESLAAALREAQGRREPN